MRVLVACEFSGIVRDAFRARGHYAVSCDLLDTERDPSHHFKGDVRDYFLMGNHLYGYWDLMIASPPCTRLANSGVRWLKTPPRGRTKKEMWEEFEKGVALYLALRNAPIPRKAIENPVMNPYAIERLGRVKRQIVQPWWFGDKAFKATGFELIGLEPLKATNKLIPPTLGTDEHKRWSKVHRASPGPNRWKDRSRMHQGIADAMAAQWG